MKVRLVLAALLLSPCSLADDWPMFRGGARDGISREQRLPTHWSIDKNIRWKSNLPGPGNSSPVVAGGKVFVTCAEDAGRKRSLFCFSRDDGKFLWSRSVAYEKNDPTHSTNPHCAASPAVDVAGNLVVVSHGSAGVHAYDMDGKPLWSKDLGSARHIWGFASSPIVHGDSIILNFGPGEGSALVSMDKKTGDVRWKQPYPGNSSLDDKGGDTKKWIGSWGTPLARTIGGREQVVAALPQHVAGFDLRTGEKLWSVGGLSDLVYADVMLEEKEEPDGSLIGVAMSGFAGPAIGFRLPKEPKGDLTESARLWRVEKNPQRIGTGVLIEGHVYAPGENVLQCIDARTGKETWRGRPDGATFWSPLAATKDKIYFTSQRGTTYVLAADPTKMTVLSTNPLDERTNSGPALSDGRVFLRTFEHLYCIE